MQLQQRIAQLLTPTKAEQIALANSPSLQQGIADAKAVLGTVDPTMTEIPPTMSIAMTSIPLSRPFWTVVSLLYLLAAVVFLAVLISLWAFGNGKTAEMILDWPNLSATAIMLASVVAGLVGLACFVTAAVAFRTAAISVPRPIAYGRLACGTLAGSCLLSLFFVHSWRINTFLMVITVPPMFASIVCFHLTLEAMRIARGKASSVLGTLVSDVLLADAGVSILFGRIYFLPSDGRVDGLASALFAGQILACLLLAAETVLTPTEE